MNLKMYSIHDSQVGAYLQPFFARSEGEAVRMVRHAVADPQSPFHKNPGDFTLTLLADLDDNTGVLSNTEPLRLINLSSLSNSDLPAPN